MPLPQTPIPHAISYPTPALPTASRGPWTLDRDRAALLVHDMQGYFLRAYDPTCPALREARTQLAELIRAARSAGVPIVYTAQPGDQPASVRGLLTPIWGPGIGADEAETGVVGDLAPQPGDRVLVKHRYSAFVGTDLAAWLAELGRDQLLVTGVYAHIGVLATATDALMRDIEPFVAGDAVVDFSAADHERALTQLASVGVAVIPSATAVSALTPPALAEDFPEIGWPTEAPAHTVPSEALQKLIAAAGYATAHDDQRVELTGAQLKLEGNAIGLVTTDGLRLAVAQITCPGLKAARSASIVPGSFVRDLESILDEDKQVSLWITSQRVIAR